MLGWRQSVMIIYDPAELHRDTGGAGAVGVSGHPLGCERWRRGGRGLDGAASRSLGAKVRQPISWAKFPIWNVSGDGLSGVSLPHIRSPARLNTFSKTRSTPRPPISPPNRHLLFPPNLHKSLAWLSLRSVATPQ